MHVVSDNTVQLAGGTATTFEIPWRVDLEGACTFTAEVDPGDMVPETDEGNNAAVLAFTAGALDVPNLEVSFHDLTFDPDPGLEGQPLTLSILVRNTGGEAVSDAEVAFYDGDPAQGGTQIGSRAVIPSLPAGGGGDAGGRSGPGCPPPPTG